jgi:cardiolipin hydrolase
LKRVAGKGLLLLLFILWIYQESPALAEVEAIFAPQESIKMYILREVESSTSTLDLAIHEMTSSDMAQALSKAKQRGVKVRIVTDSKQSKMKLSQVAYLIHQGIPIKVLGGKEKGVMNHRFLILDGKKVITGSFDWTETSEKWNYENILVLPEVDAVSLYQKEFERLWREKRIIR